MNLASISFSYLRVRNLSTVLSVALLAFGVAATVLLLLAARQLGERMQLDVRDIDLVVGAKGSALQLVLSSVYQLDVPTGPIRWSRVQEIAARADVRRAVPIEAADHYRGFRIVGTTHEFLKHYRVRLREGRSWQAPLEAVVGSEVAMRTGLNLGSAFESTHDSMSASDHVQSERPLRVVGIAQPTGTVLDHVIVTDIASVWALHDEDPQEGALVTEPRPEEGREVNAILVQATSAQAAAKLTADLNADGELQAVTPAHETARLFNAVVVGTTILRGFAAVLILAAGLSIFVALYSALSDRRYDLAIMRVLGASPRELMALLFFEGVLLGAIGASLGLMLGHVLTSLLGAVLRYEQVVITGWVWDMNEVWIVAGALAVGALASLAPAWRAHETDIASTLARG